MTTSLLTHNGVECKIKHLTSSTSVTIAYFFDVGLPSEERNMGGASHFLEHMCFRGTSRRSSFDITREVDALGGQINAYTTKEFTCFFITVLPENLKEGIDILSDIVFHSLLNDADITLEQSIISEEIKMYEDTPDEKIHDEFNALMFDDAYLGKPILGTFDSINHISSSSLRQFYANYFNPSRVKCVIAGPITPSDKNFSSLTTALDHVQWATSPAHETTSEIPSTTSSKKHIEKDLEQVHLCIGYPGHHYTHQNRYSLTVLSNILGGSMSSRLFQSVREKEGLAYSIYSSPSFYKNNGTLVIYAGTSPTHLKQTSFLISKEIESLVSNGINAEEFNRSINQLKGNIIINLEGSASWANWIGRQLIYNTRVEAISDIESQLNALTIDRINQTIKDIFDPTKLVSVTLGQTPQS